MNAKSLATSAGVPSNFLDDDFAQHVRLLLEEHHIPGMSVAIVDAGRVSAQGYGLARFPDVEASSDTLYYIGSITKAMVAAAAGVLIHGEKEESNPSLTTLQTNGWATTIRSMLSSKFQLSDEYATANITVEDALSHRTGVSGADYMYGDWMSKDPEAIVQAYKHVGYLTKPFRTSWQYNNMMYSVVADALKAVKSLDCGPLLKKLIWDPLCMSSTYWRLEEIPTPKREKDLARGYYWVEKGEQRGYFVPEPYFEFAGIAPAGAAISSVMDFAKWIVELLDAAKQSQGSSEPEARRVITKELFKELVTPRSIIPEGAIYDHHRTYALGWILAPPIAGIDHPIMCHAGGLNGFGTQAYILPNDGFGVVTMGNAAKSSNIAGDIIALGLLSRKLGLVGAEKAKFVETLRAKLPQNAALDPAAKTGSAGPSPAKDEVAGNFLQSLIGDYEHPAFGHFRVSIYDGLRQHKPIVYPSWIPYSQRTERDDRRNQLPCLEVVPIGARTWSYKLLLHLRPDYQQGVRHMVSGPHQDKTLLFLDMENLKGHGNIEDDVLQGLPTGLEHSDEQPCLRREVIWESHNLTRLSAAIKLPCEEANSTGTTSPSCIIGIRLLSSLIDTDGDNEAGWEERLVWFKPVTLPRSE